MEASIAAEYKVLAARGMSALHGAIVKAEKEGGLKMRAFEILRQDLRGRYQALEFCEDINRRSQEEIQYDVGGCPFDAEAHAEDLESDKQQEEYRRLFRNGR